MGNLVGHDYIEATRKYLDYLEEHLDNIEKAHEEVMEACMDMFFVTDMLAWWELMGEVSHHDESKFSAEEFTQYRAKFFPVAWDDKDRTKAGFESAWEHHKNENPHHHETVKTDLDIVHMVIDWTAMSYKFGDTPWDFYESKKADMDLSDAQHTLIIDILSRLKAHRGVQS